METSVLNSPWRHTHQCVHAKWGSWCVWFLRCGVCCRYGAVRGGGRPDGAGGGAAAPPAGQTEGTAADRWPHTHIPGAKPAAQTPAQPGQTGNAHSSLCTHTHSDFLLPTCVCVCVCASLRCWAGSLRGRWSCPPACWTPAVCLKPSSCSGSMSASNRPSRLLQTHRPEIKHLILKSVTINNQLTAWSIINSHSDNRDVTMWFLFLFSLLFWLSCFILDKLKYFPAPVFLQL